MAGLRIPNPGAVSIGIFPRTLEVDSLHSCNDRTPIKNTGTVQARQCQFIIRRTSARLHMDNVLELTVG